MTALLNSTVGEYRLVDFLGAGGMGEVYRAIHPKLGRVVAVKILTHAGADSSFVERFLNEARIQADLHHPNIATLYDFIEANGRPCIIMEYVAGQSLDALIRANGVFPLSEAIFIFRAVLEAIGYIHNRGIIHRDIKPNNIKITTQGEVKLLDFGIAKAAYSPHLTMTGNVIGTMQYLSPEQIKGKTADVRADIWALGVLFYEMVTGISPFDATTLGEICEKISKAGYRPPSACNPAIPQEIESIIARCLRKNPTDRYPSVQSLRIDIDKISTLISTPRLRDSTLAKSGQVNPVKTLLNSTKLYWPLALASIIMVILAVWNFWPNVDPKPPIARPADQEGQATAPVLILKDTPSIQESRRVRIGVVGESAQLYLSRNGKWQGPYNTPYEFSAPLGEQIKWKLTRTGFRDKTGKFNVQVDNQYLYTLCKVEEDCAE
ncbi:MAG: serine/threonine-protein kinase [Candidatus Competibacteraceae bacterium]